MIFIFLTILSWISGYRDLVRFIYKKDGAWSIESKARWVPYWEAKPPWDPFHVSGGVRTTIAFAFLVWLAMWVYFFEELPIKLIYFIIGNEWYWFLLTGALHIVIGWGFFYWMRDIFMHIISRTKNYREYEYLYPFNWWQK